ncbi:MAG: glucose-6-phosphate isomerase family protein [Candidatus Aenigmatarchaeota archaeon]
MDFGFSIKKQGKKLSLNFGKKVECRKRYLSELLKDRVILDLESAKELLERKGDLTIYEVYNLWKFQDVARDFLENFGVMVDITLLRQGIFSLKKEGEAFCTYGHIHKENLGEVYVALKNGCYLLLSHRKTFNSYLIEIKEGYSFFIPPFFIHRLISGKKDCVVLNFVHEIAGHDYSVVKNKGFPFHIFYDKNKNLEFRENKKYPEVGLVFIKNIKKFDVLKLAKKEPEKLKEILSSWKESEVFDEIFHEFD